jgi:hypothetical protein
VVDPQPVAKCADKFLRIVTNARLAEIAEVGEIFADLGVVDSQSIPQLAAGYDFQALFFPALQMSKVKTEPLDAGP